MGNRPRRVLCAAKSCVRIAVAVAFWCVRPARELKQQVHVHLPDVYYCCRVCDIAVPLSLTVSLAVIQLSGIGKPSLVLSTQSRKCLE